MGRRRQGPARTAGSPGPGTVRAGVRGREPSRNLVQGSGACRVRSAERARAVRVAGAASAPRAVARGAASGVASGVAPSGSKVARRASAIPRVASADGAYGARMGHMGRTAGLDRLRRTAPGDRAGAAASPTVTNDRIAEQRLQVERPQWFQHPAPDPRRVCRGGRVCRVCRWAIVADGRGTGGVPADQVRIGAALPGLAGRCRHAPGDQQDHRRRALRDLDTPVGPGPGRSCRVPLEGGPVQVSVTGHRDRAPWHAGPDRPLVPREEARREIEPWPPPRENLPSGWRRRLRYSAAARARAVLAKTGIPLTG